MLNFSASILQACPEVRSLAPEGTGLTDKINHPNKWHWLVKLASSSCISVASRAYHVYRGRSRENLNFLSFISFTPIPQGKKTFFTEMYHQPKILRLFIFFRKKNIFYDTCFHSTYFFCKKVRQLMFFPSKSWLQKNSNGRSVAPPSSHLSVLNPSPRLAGEDVNGGFAGEDGVFGWLLF